MGAGIDAVPVHHAGDPMHTDSSDWQPTARRVVDYLTALGVRERLEIERLSEQVRRRVETRATTTPLEDSVEAAIEETHALLDEWLIAELGIDGDANALTAARAAVLGGDIPGWSARWAGLAGDSLAPAIRAIHLVAVPEFAPLAMQSSTIDLCCQRMRRQIAAAICRLFCQPDMRTNSRGGSS
jgi:hypothetical protein